MGNEYDCALLVFNGKQNQVETGMENTMKNERIYEMTFSSVYPMYIQKAEKKGRTKEEVDTVICWLTGYDDPSLQLQIENDVTFETFFAEAPQINPNANKITGLSAAFAWRKSNTH